MNLTEELIELKAIYEKIWEKALPYQDKREDNGHAAITLQFARKLLETEKADPDIVIPAIILHDIGWSQMSKEERFLIFNLNAGKEEKLKMRYKHQEEGSRLAGEILEWLVYYPTLTRQIKEIISQHDTREGTISIEDSVVRDADKLWRFSNTGFWADIRRMKIQPKELYNRLERQIDEEGFFFTVSARCIALEELNQRRKEFKI